jgi:hypothetical protein
MNVKSIATMLATAFLATAGVKADPLPAFSAEEVGKLQNLMDGDKGHQGRVAKDILLALGLTTPGPFRSFTLEPGGDVAYEISTLPGGAGFLMIEADHTSNIRLFLTDPHFGLVSAVERLGRKQAYAMPIADAFKLYADEVAAWRSFLVSPDAPAN